MLINILQTSYNKHPLPCLLNITNGKHSPKVNMPHLAWPMWDSSYTVGPQLYQVTTWLCGTNSSFRRVKELYRCSLGFSTPSGAVHLGSARFGIVQPEDMWSWSESWHLCWVLWCRILLLNATTKKFIHDALLQTLHILVNEALQHASFSFTK